MPEFPPDYVPPVKPVFVDTGNPEEDFNVWFEQCLVECFGATQEEITYFLGWRRWKLAGSPKNPDLDVLSLDGDGNVDFGDGVALHNTSPDLYARPVRRHW